MKNTKKLFIYFLLLLVSISLVSGVFVVRQVSANSNTSDSQKQLDEMNAKLAQLKKEKDKINEQLNAEKNNVNTLQQQQKNIDNSIRQSEIQVETLELEIDKLNLEVTILTDEMGKLEARLAEYDIASQKLNSDLDASINLLYKLSMTDPTFLDDNTTFEQIIINQEKQKSTLRIIKSQILDLENLKKEVSEKKTEIATKQTEVKTKQEELTAQSNSLNMQISSLRWQKQNKQNLINQSNKTQGELQARDKEYQKAIAEFEAEIERRKQQLIGLPISGTFVTAGQTIGFQGRSGLSCSYWDSKAEPIKTNNFCQKYAGLGSNWYYYEPSKYPTKGSHLHFEYYVNKKKIYPYDQLTNPNNKDFKSMPMTPFSISNGNHQGGAIDLVSSHGAPVKAVKSGYVSYYCINYPNDPAFTDPAYGAIVQHIGEDGKADGTISQYWHLQRGNKPCNFI